MPDISMCEGFACPLKKKCYRCEESGTKPSEYRQSYFVVTPYDHEKETCNYFWER